MLTDEFNTKLHPERENMVSLAHMSALVGGKKTTELIQQDQAENATDSDVVMSDESFTQTAGAVPQDVVFLYKMENGVCPKSYGINVAKMAEVPLAVLQKADKIAESFSKSKNLAQFKVTSRKEAKIRQKLRALEQLVQLAEQAEAEQALQLQTNSHIKAQAQALAQLAIRLVTSPATPK